uniref:BUB1 N-terminal domain-containing protein n=1 Tax=Oryza meridionalis TaxID=40149 RepID=A0A0E0E130_9ORYZ
MVLLERSPLVVPEAAAAAASSPLRRPLPRVRREVPPPPLDPILPYLQLNLDERKCENGGVCSPKKKKKRKRIKRSINKAMDELRTGPKFEAAALDRLKICVTECIDKYGDDYQYSTDPRLLKIWILYADAIGDFDKVYRQLEEKKNGEVLEAGKVYELGISRKAEPLDHLKKTHTIFLKHLEKIVEEADADAQSYVVK